MISNQNNVKIKSLKKLYKYGWISSWILKPKTYVKS